MRNSPNVLNLTLDLKKTNLHCDQLIDLEKQLFQSNDEEEDIFFKAQEILIKDRSIEAVHIFKKLALAEEHQLNRTFGMESLALIGEGAVPAIMEILLCKRHDRVFYMIEELFSPDGIEFDKALVSLPNLISLRTIIRKHDEWSIVINYLVQEKGKAWEKLQDVIVNLLETERLIRSIDINDSYNKVFNSLIELGLQNQVASGKIPQSDFISGFTDFLVINCLTMNSQKGLQEQNVVSVIQRMKKTLDNWKEGKHLGDSVKQQLSKA